MSLSSNSPVATSSSETQPPGAADPEGCKGHARWPGALWRAPLGALRRFAGWVVHTPERLRHDRRHLEALDRLEAMPRPRSLLFVCIGNICRSPYAEHRLLDLVSPGVAARLVVRSAGFGKWDRPSPPEAVAEARERGVDLTEHRSQAVTHEVVDATDLFLVTDIHQERRLRREQGVDPMRIVHLGDLDPEPISRRTIVDPWGKGADVFRESYDRIDRCLGVLAEALQGDTSPRSTA